MRLALRFRNLISNVERPRRAISVVRPPARFPIGTLVKLAFFLLIGPVALACGGTAAPEVNREVVAALRVLLGAARTAFQTRDLRYLDDLVNQSGAAYLKGEWEADWREGAISRIDQDLRIHSIDQFSAETAAVDFSISYCFRYDHGREENMPMRHRLFFRRSGGDWLLDGGHARLR